MDEIRFAATTTYTVKKLREFSITYQKRLMIAVTILVYACALFVVPVSISNGDYGMTALYAALMLITALLYAYQYYFASLSYKRGLEVNGGAPLMYKTIVYDTHIEEINLAKNMSVNFDYRTIKRCRVSKNQINVYTRAKQGVLITKTDMEVGDWQACAAFIKQKIEENKGNK